MTYIEEHPLVEELLKIPQSQWPKIYCQLNSWRWPTELNHIKPTWWDEGNNKFTGVRKYLCMKPLMNKIVSTISEKILNRESNKDRMNDEQFEEWWANKDNAEWIENRMRDFFKECKNNKQ